MRRLLILSLVMISLVTQSYANFENFYLTSEKEVEKLVPNTLSDTVNVGESRSFHVDMLPYGTNDEIIWKIENPIATLSCNGASCRVKAIFPGKTAITATTSTGVSCNIKIKIEEKRPQIFLESSDVANSGESIIIKARTSTDDTVKWSVDGIEPTRISYGGNMCKIKPKRAGLIKISASLGDTTVSKTLEILPSKNSELDLDSLALFLAGCGVILLLIILIYGRGYEKKH